MTVAARNDWSRSNGLAWRCDRIVEVVGGMIDKEARGSDWVDSEATAPPAIAYKVER